MKKKKEKEKEMNIYLYPEQLHQISSALMLL